MVDVAERTLSEIVTAITEVIDRPASSQQQLLDRLRDMADRLNTTRFQLAVLGQFKRGKSTLLNAFLGYPFLSAGVLPLTAVPTFLFGSPTMVLRLQYLTGAIEEQEVKGTGEMVAAIAAATTEEQNPRNEKGLKRVDAGISSNPWLSDLTLVDTPGIGSTYLHNTEAAHAVLPECDAALFVLSVDPPITDTELQYLTTICQTVSRIIVVLNKIDLVDQADREKAIAFLSLVISQQNTANIDRKIFPVSARLALAAREGGDSVGLEQSGLPALEKYVRSTLVDQKRNHLEYSVARKASDILDALEADEALTARALALPLTELDEKVALFEAAAVDFERERDNLQDLLSGEWRRANAKLDGLCEAAKKRIRRELDSVVLDVSRFSQSGSEPGVVESVMSAVFDKELETIGTAIDKELAAAVSDHQERYRDLVKRVQDAAAALMSLPMRPVVADEWFQIKREPYWVGQARVESLSSITVDGIFRILPEKFRRRRWLKQLRVAVDKAVTRNISDLHWTMRQNIDDSFRRLLGSSDEAVNASIATTRDALRMARESRASTNESLQAEIERMSAIRERLAAIRMQLDRHLERMRA